MYVQNAGNMVWPISPINGMIKLYACVKNIHIFCYLYFIGKAIPQGTDILYKVSL